jgi:NTE family protein
MGIGIDSTLRGIFGKIINEVEKTGGEAAEIAKDIAQPIDQFVHEAVTAVEQKGLGIFGGLSHLHLFGFGDDSRGKLIDATKDLRAKAGAVRSLQDQLGKLDPKDPKYAQVKAQLDQASAALKSGYGYDAKNLPAPGSLWVDPEFLGKELPNDQVSASKFPVGKPVLTPPDPETALFGSRQGQPYRMTNELGEASRAMPPKTMAQYERSVSDHRAALGIPVLDGKPIGVQMNFEGGGGKGKRYSAAMQEMASLGIVPTSVAGTSAGSIAAALVAAGADPVEMQRFVTDPALSHLLDIHVDGAGIASGKAAFDLINQELAKLTGITDRPVTFADLKMPLQLVATKMSDSSPDAGTGDLSQAKNRIFVFSQQTTPNTPVALAVRASMSIPGVFDPVQMVDPMTGREVKLVDGGVLDNLPMNESPNFHLPVVGVGLTSPDSDNPDARRDAPQSLPKGNLDVSNLFGNALYGLDLWKKAASDTNDYQDRANPKPGQFMLTLPVWNLNDQSQGDSTMNFGYDTKVDPILDQQTRQVTQDFFRNVIGRLQDPTASGSNIPSKIAPDFSFDRGVTINGHDYRATYAKGDSVHFAATDGSKSFDVNLGRDKIEAMVADDYTFHDLAAQLQHAAN